MDTLNTLKRVTAKQFGAEFDAIDENATVDALGIDSLGFLEFIFELEDSFGVSIPQELLSQVKTLRDLADAIDGLIAARSAAES